MIQLQGESIDRYMQRMAAIQRLWCPYCREEIAFVMEEGPFVTVFGTVDGVDTATCGHCGESFLFREEVFRSYTSMKRKEQEHVVGNDNRLRPDGGKATDSNAGEHNKSV